jgi:hypothetical protein
MADNHVTNQASETAEPNAPQQIRAALEAPKTDKEYVKPKVVRVRRVLAAGGHKL